MFYIYKFNNSVLSDPLLSGVTFEKDGKTEKGCKMVEERLSKVEVVVEKQIKNNLNKNNSEKQKSYKSLFF